MLLRTNALRLAVFAALGIPVGVLGASCSDSTGSGGDPGGGGQTATGGTNPGGATASGGSGGSVPHPLKACANAKAILDKDGGDTGYVKCEDGSIDRVEAKACADDSVPACTGGEDEIDCTTDADCADKPNTRCGLVDGGSLYACTCIPVCKTDADCAGTASCVCKGVVAGLDHATCAASGCHGPSDCGGDECGLDVYQDCSPVPSLYCRDLEKDACRVDAQCGDRGCYAEHPNAPDASNHRVCELEGCEGRLLRGEAGLVSARSTERGDWAEGRRCASTAGLSDATRRALAEHWSRVAATEHAAVASFARFTLQLLANGAPPEFLAASQRAAAEEIEHARRAYAIASGFAGEAIGPGRLDACSLPLDATRWGLIEGLIDDACVSELVNVTEVLALASVATDPAVVAFAQQTADEEAAHVALAWRVLRWALEGASVAERRDARGRLEARMTALHAVDEVAIAAPEHGLLAGKDRLAIRQRALRDVAEPAIETLFAGLAGFEVPPVPGHARAGA